MDVHHDLHRHEVLDQRQQVVRGAHHDRHRGEQQDVRGLQREGHHECRRVAQVRHQQRLVDGVPARRVGVRDALHVRMKHLREVHVARDELLAQVHQDVRDGAIALHGLSRQLKRRESEERFRRHTCCIERAQNQRHQRDVSIGDIRVTIPMQELRHNRNQNGYLAEYDKIREAHNKHTLTVVEDEHEPTMIVLLQESTLLVFQSGTKDYVGEGMSCRNTNVVVPFIQNQMTRSKECFFFIVVIPFLDSVVDLSLDFLRQPDKFEFVCISCDTDQQG